MHVCVCGMHASVLYACAIPGVLEVYAGKYDLEVRSGGGIVDVDNVGLINPDLHGIEKRQPIKKEHANKKKIYCVHTRRIHFFRRT